MQNGGKGKKILFIVLIVLMVISVLGHLKNCRAAAESYDDWPEIPEPDPSYSWEDYMTEHPVLTAEPTEEPPTEPPTRGPMVMATNIYQYARLRAYRYYVEPVIPPPGQHMYQSLVSPYQSSTSVTSFASVSSTNYSDRRVYSSDNRSGGVPVLNHTDGAINCLDSYVVFDWEFRYSSSTDIVEGVGLNNGYVSIFNFQYVINIFDHYSGEVVLDLPCSVYYTIYYDTGYTRNGSIDSEICSTIMDLKRGFSYPIYSDDQQQRKISKIVFKFQLGTSPEFMLSDPLGSAAATRAQSVRTFDLVSETSSGHNAFIVSVSTQQFHDYPKETFNFLSNIWQFFANAVIPSRQQLNEWITNHVNTSVAPGAESLMTPYQAFLQLLQSILDGNDTDSFVLKVPALKIYVNGMQYQYFDGINFDLASADIGIPNTNHTLFYYTRLVGDCIIVAGFITGFLYKRWKRVFDIQFTSGSGGD